MVVRREEVDGFTELQLCLSEPAGEDVSEVRLAGERWGSAVGAVTGVEVPDLLRLRSVTGSA